ncbi:protein CutA homolog [Plodia interpunctella]|uniref:protein CutA homolog n=1 Tax=Plodia interpunctella TaxID=58824 RepID=UPI0023683F60|nr:protein CutA homolog [Plodia interpunctella]
MMIKINRKSIFALYLTVFKPFFVLSQANMSSGVTEADKYSVAYVTVPSMEVGKTIGHGLVKNKLAACVNIIPQVTSIYEWKNEINEDSELLLMIKTRTSQVDKLTEFVRSNHPYEVCEVISLPIKNGNPPYLKWIGETVPESVAKN